MAGFKQYSNLFQTHYQTNILISRHFKTYLLRSTVIFTGLLLFACAPGGTKSVDQVISEAVKNQSIQTEQLDTDSPEYYIRLASEAEGDNRQQYLLKAAELLIKRGDIRLAQNQLQNLKPEQLEGNKQAQIKILAARIALANNNSVQAIELLPPADVLNLYQTIEAGTIAADANFQLGYFMQAVDRRVAIDALFETDDLREQNHQAIWLALSSMPDIDLMQHSSNDKETQGWIELARIMRRAQTSLGWLQENVLDWGTEYPAHPVSNTFIDYILDLHLANKKTTANIAVMLPMQGEYGPAGEAIKNGFLLAHYDNDTEDKPTIRFYDTSEPDTDFESIYQQALQDGAQAIIGPLDKITINRLAQKNELEIPVLTLNYAENPLNNAENLYQFGLLPEDEARQVAELAIRQNKKRAAVFTPNSAWGSRLQQAFSQRFEELGGNITSAKQYDPHADDYSKPIKKMFNIDQSHRRHRDLQRLLDIKLKFLPYRRQDVDMIFLAATHRSARGIVPAFKFHHAGELPVYATSHVYTGHHDKAADRDLNGLLFCDLPWNLTSRHKLKRSFNEHWPDQQSYTRLFALGLDAYYLVRNLTYLEENKYARFPGETGNLYLDESGRVHRELVWARFKRGLPVYLDLHKLPVTEPEPTPSNTVENNS